jgi:thiosulfate reductase cytochrome b subunit
LPQRNVRRGTPHYFAGMNDSSAIEQSVTRHACWVKLSHWIVTLSFFTLAFSGFVVLMAHPRLYWGETGNNLTPALLELPISRNHHHPGWENPTPFFARAASPITANRTYDIFNQNGWGRSLHFLAAWFLVVPGAIYLLGGLLTRHFRRHLVPRAREFGSGLFKQDLINHLRLRITTAIGGPHYGVLQKCAYCAVVFVALPLAVVTGLAMSPAITATYPFLSAMFGGFQSARTVHFFTSVVLLVFVIVHVVMIVKSGFRRQMRAMTFGE